MHVHILIYHEPVGFIVGMEGWFNIRESHQCNSHFKRLKEKSYMLVSVDLKKKKNTFEVVECAVASVISSSLQPYGLQPTRLLCPWDPPGKNNGVSCHFLPQGNLPNPRLLHLLAGRFYITSATQETRDSISQLNKNSIRFQWLL